MAKYDAIQFIGTQRSGSNLLRLMLNQHDEISAPHPPHILKTFKPIISEYGDLSVHSNRKILVEDVYDWIKKNPIEWTLFDIDIESVSARVDSIIDVFVNVYDQKRIADKASIWCCKSTFNIKWIEELDESVRPFYIYLYRDGRDVAASFKKAYAGPKHVYHIASQWHSDQQMTKKFLSTIQDERYSMIKYEDLVSDPERVLIEICRKLEIPFQSQMLKYFKSEESQHTAESGEMWQNVTKPIIKNNTQKYKQELSEVEINIFENVAYRSLMELNMGVSDSYTKLKFTEVDLKNFDSLNALKKVEIQRGVSDDEKAHRIGQEELLKSIKERFAILQD